MNNLTYFTKYHYNFHKNHLQAVHACNVISNIKNLLLLVRLVSHTLFSKFPLGIEQMSPTPNAQYNFMLTLLNYLIKQ